MMWTRNARNKLKTEYKLTYHKRQCFIRNLRNKPMKHNKYNKTKSTGQQNNIYKIKIVLYKHKGISESCHAMNTQVNEKTDIQGQTKKIL